MVVKSGWTRWCICAIVLAFAGWAACGDVSEKPCEPGETCQPDAIQPPDGPGDRPDAPVSDLQLLGGQISTAGPASGSGSLSLVEHGFEYGATVCMNQLCATGGITP